MKQRSHSLACVSHKVGNHAGSSVKIMRK